VNHDERAVGVETCEDVVADPLPKALAFDRTVGLLTAFYGIVEDDEPEATAGDVTADTAGNEAAVVTL
jgi:hypothetical protein